MIVRSRIMHSYRQHHRRRHHHCGLYGSFQRFCRVLPILRDITRTTCNVNTAVYFQVIVDYCSSQVHRATHWSRSVNWCMVQV